MFWNKLIFFSILILPLGAIAQDTVKTDSSVIIKKQSSYSHPPLTAFIPPAVFVTYGILSFHIKGIRQIDYNVYNDMQKDHPGFKTHADNYLQYAPGVAVYALNLAGIQGKHNFADRTILYVLSEGIFAGSTFLGKRISHRSRPSNADEYSFPSGHTGNAFASAEFLTQEYGDVSPWYGIAGYSVAAATGVLRVYNNAHWFSDVVAGAGVGILSTKFAYLIYPLLKQTFGSGKKDASTVIMPTYQNSMFGFTFVKTL
ncbi:phosphatase PAP2 family protein [Mucilaginibacter aquaedulcis]|uniref:phosphatase PAP2 family protein n=1 Tax=Mucilaginibacter aquaedulcis TaxID=1187081 RepID=UPI0025B4F578|nr:phosphatase PAP2 family protein [Mucilaginibacter aquaedulcis]MDN3549577.1 phosphatase PAP2 family protein [Mucilaginibacter aquaedulcis]